MGPALPHGPNSQKAKHHLTTTAPVKSCASEIDVVKSLLRRAPADMADDDDWETDPDFENTMTEEEKRKAGNPDLLAKQKEEGVGHITMDSIQNKKLAESERPKEPYMENQAQVA